LVLESNSIMSTNNSHDSLERNEPSSVNAACLPSGTLPRKKTLRFKIRGWSMHPLIRPGDTVDIASADAGELARGDIVLFRVDSGNFIMHRVIHTDKNGLIATNGDSMHGSDEPITGEQVFGKLIRIEHDGKALILEGKVNKLISWLITRLSQCRLPLQITIKQTLARILWLFRGKRIL
jgi:signal peptidase I